MTIPAGQTSVQFNIPVVDELIVEREEQFQVSFTYSGDQPGVEVNQDSDEAHITIRNDDGQFRLDDIGSMCYVYVASTTYICTVYASIYIMYVWVLLY